MVRVVRRRLVVGAGVILAVILVGWAALALNHQRPGDHPAQPAPSASPGNPANPANPDSPGSTPSVSGAQSGLTVPSTSGASSGQPPPSTSTAAARPRLRMGAYVGGMDASPAKLDATATQLGQPLSIASVFRGPDWAAAVRETWPNATDRALGRGRTLLVAWSLQEYGNYAWWSSGRGDAVLRSLAGRLRAYPGQVAIRPWAEMNADWVDFQPTPAGKPAKARGGTPTQFIAAWRHVVQVLRGAGVTNVAWVFNPTTDTYVETTDVRTIYPGNAYVDILGLDGYNWGTGKGLQWRSFADVYTQQYQRLVQVGPGKPVWICEISSSDPASTAASEAGISGPSGASKGGWWRQAWVSLSGMPQVRAVVLFSVDKERDWRVDSSPGALQGLRQALNQG